MGKGNEAVRDFFKKHQINYQVYIDGDAFPDPKSYDIVVKSSGIKFNTEFLKINDKKVVSDLELSQWFDGKRNKIAVTGTNGKTTTATLIYEILSKEMKVLLAGNIGTPIFSVIEEEGIMVVEASSFMLHNVETFHPNVAVLLNIFPNHLEYHQSIANYLEDKLKMIQNTTDDDYIVYNADDDLISLNVKSFKGKKIPFSLTRKVKGAYVDKNAIYYQNEKIIETREILIPGIHNIANILASIIVGKIYRIKSSLIRQAIKSFKGVPHRLEVLPSRIPIINDSKSTNPIALLSALNCFRDKRVLLIAGGKDKNDDFSILRYNLDNVKIALLYGENKDILKSLFAGEKIDTKLYQTLDQVVDNLESHLSKIDLILFSPGSSSLDQYNNFEERGNHFKELMKKWFISN